MCERANIICLLASSDSSTSEHESSSSSSDEELIRVQQNRSKNFMGVITKLNIEQYRAHFRVSRNTMEYLLEKLVSSHILPHPHKGGRDMVPPDKALLITIWYLANLETFRQIGDRFDVTKSTALVYVRLVVKFLVNVSKDHIKWPEGQRVQQIIQGFQQKQNFDGIIGCIDGTHIPIKKPKNHKSYWNRKGFTSILLQGICDHEKKFIDVFCGEPGSMHDARVLRRSGLYKYAYDYGLPGNVFLLGDSAYPNLPWLVVPFRDNGHLTEEQKNFNYRLSSTRITIEHCFGLLKGRFRRLKHFENTDIKFIVDATIAACVLHNICIDFDDHYLSIDLSDTEEIEEDITMELQPGIDRRLSLM